MSTIAIARKNNHVGIATDTRVAMDRLDKVAVTIQRRENHLLKI